ncbi:unnamed protein product, partial [Vitis vinifera]
MQIRLPTAVEVNKVDTISEFLERIGQPDCGYYLKTRTCKYGSICKYHHSRDRLDAGPVSLNIVGLSMRQEEKPCSYYMRTGLCKFGVACKFHHLQPASIGTGYRMWVHKPTCLLSFLLLKALYLHKVGTLTWET